jgi:hypothetical protein
VLRFDYGGNGDSSGRILLQADAADDVRRGIDTIIATVPRVTAIVLWGVCGAGPASVLYAAADPRIRGIIVGNPPIEQFGYIQLQRGIERRLVPGAPAFAKPASRAVSRVTARVLEMLQSAPAESARRGIRQRVAARVVRVLGSTFVRLSENDGRSLGVLGHYLLSTSRRDAFIDGLNAFSGWSLILLSDNDDGAATFNRLVLGTTHLDAPLTIDRMTCHPIRAGGHTFAPTASREEVTRVTLDWLLALRESHNYQSMPNA